MTPWARKCLVVFALVYCTLARVATSDPQLVELQEVKWMLGDGHHDLGSFPSAPAGLRAHQETSQAVVLEEYLNRVASGRRESTNKDGSRESGVSSGREESKHGSRELRVSRGLLQQSSQATCPVDFQFMRKFPWYDQSCRNFNPSDQNLTCCNALTSAIGQAWSEHLRVSGQFRLKDEATVGACMASLSAQLHSEDNELSSLIVPTCYPESNYSSYVSHPTNCQGIETRADFERTAGVSTIDSTLNRSCSNPDIIDLKYCSLCVDAIYSVVPKLSSMSPNNSDCLFYTLFYAAGVSSLNGPLDPGTANCVLATTIAKPRKGNSGALAVHIGIGAAAAFAGSVVACICFFLWWRRRRGAARRAFIERNTGLLKPAMMRPNTGLIEYSFEEIKAATDGFSAKNYIGSGGFGDVYHGVLDDGLEVAIKRMKNCSKDGDADFINEVNVINSVRHRNLVILRGCCVASTEADGHQRLLIYDYMPNGSLQDYLFGKQTITPVLEWPDRRRLAIGAAKGIAYLHNDARPSIIHRDIKAANVLLDEKLDAKVADFGLAKFTIEGESHAATPVAGTLGYVAPEYALYGQLTERSDVYSFGVLLLELMSGRSAIEEVLGESSLITDWAWGIVKDGNVLDIVDARIRNVGPRDVMERFVLVGILCSHMLVAFRPGMEEALKYLEGDSPLPHIPNRPLPINSISLPWHLTPAPAAGLPPPPRPPPHSSPTRSPPPINIAAAMDALSDETDSESVKLQRAQRAAMREFSGHSAGVHMDSLLR